MYIKLFCSILSLLIFIGGGVKNPHSRVHSLYIYDEKMKAMSSFGGDMCNSSKVNLIDFNIKMNMNEFLFFFANWPIIDISLFPQQIIAITVDKCLFIFFFC